MHIKQPTVLPPGFKVTKCPPAEANAPSVYTLLKREERKLMNQSISEETMRERAAAFYLSNGYHPTGIDSNGEFY